MNILLAGGCGYIGTLLTRALLDDGHALTVVDAMWFGNHLAPHPRLQIVRADIREPETIPMADCEAVLHLANVANDPCSELNAKLSWEVNTLAAMRLVERAIRHGARRFIYASSGSVYGVKTEPDVTEDLELTPISDYNKTKMAAERVLLSYRDDILIQCVRPATVCGYSPRMRLDLSVNMLAMQALSRGRITVFGGAQTRPNIHIRDMIGVYRHLLALGERAPGVFNAGFENLSILEIARIVTEYAPAEITVSESDDPRSYRLNADKLLATGFRRQYTVRDAVRELRDLYQQGVLRDDDACYNLRAMKKIPGLT